MAITLSATSLSRLEGVHPDLVRVVKRAALIATPEQDFLVIQGVRPYEDLCVNWGKGRTVEQCEAKGVPGKYAAPAAAKVTWLSDPFGSKHAVQKDGYGHAVDCGPYPLDWKNMAGFRMVADLMRSAAQQEGVAIIRGIDWKTSPDAPHTELAG